MSLMRVKEQFKLLAEQQDQECFKGSDDLSTEFFKILILCPYFIADAKIPGLLIITRYLCQKSSAAQLMQKSFFYNWPTPASFSFIFGLFKQSSIQILQQINVKNVNSIQYMAPGFEPTTSRSRVISQNHQTRAPALRKVSYLKLNSSFVNNASRLNELIINAAVRFH